MPCIAEAAAAAYAAGTEAFKYNRENYMFDNALRFGRFMAQYQNVQAQVEMYRDDIRDLTAFTVTKQDTYHTVGTIFFVLNFQLIMAGRLGVHGPSPPGWIMGLYWTNICSALMFLVTFTWMAMHASARATAGSAYMLTRNVRIPIPTPKMLDKARTTGNSFERQRVSDMFRIPFAMPAPKEPYVEEDPEAGSPSKATSDQRRMPKWYQDEVKELQEEGDTAPATSNPEHFELYRGLQEEWWSHDVYSRIGVLYFMSHWLTAAAIYSMCHVFSELRILWSAWSVTACFVVAHYCLLTLDIVNPPREGGLMSLPVEKVFPYMPVIACLGMSIDYSVLQPSVFWQALIYFLSWICYVLQFVWGLRLYELAAPKEQQEVSERPGQPWWPSEWHLPPAFADTVYMVAAPKHLEPGHTCLMQEMRAGRGTKRQEAAVKKARPAQPSQFPWKLFRGACITTISMRTLIMVGRVFEHVNGEKQLLKPENRHNRWPTHVQPWVAPWSRKGQRNEWCHAGGCDRRLSARGQGGVAEMAHQLMAALGPIAEALEAPRAADLLVELEPAPLLGSEVRWPAGLQPTLLASGGRSIAALTPWRRGAMLHLDEERSGFVAAEEFLLEGIEPLGDIVGVSLGQAGLVVTTASGILAECAGMPARGAWSCQQVGGKLPLAGIALKAGVACRVADTGRLRAAVVLDEEEGGLLLLDADGDGAGPWLPSGEVRLLLPAGQAPQLSLTASGEELLIAAGDGEVLKWPFMGGQPLKVARAESLGAVAPRTWHGACSLDGDRVAHLATPADGAAPLLYISASRL